MTDLIDLRARLALAYRKALRTRHPMWARRMVMLILAIRRLDDRIAREHGR